MNCTVYSHHILINHMCLTFYKYKASLGKRVVYFVTRFSCFFTTLSKIVISKHFFEISVDLKRINENMIIYESETFDNML